jgi:alpha-glucosidase
MRKVDGGETVVVACNFTAQPQTVSFEPSAQGLHGESVRTLLKTPGAADPSSLHSIQLGPYGVYIGQVQ